MLTTLMAIGLVGAFFALMAVRIILKKDGEFQGTCASQSPFLNKEGVTCSLCGKEPAFCESNDDEEGGQAQPQAPVSDLPPIGQPSKRQEVAA